MRTNEPFKFSSVPSSATEVIKVHSRSFYLASLFLPREIAQDVGLLYAWCRWCDDAVDKAPSLDVARQRLAALRQDIDRIEHGRQPLQSCSRWLADVKHKYNLPGRLCHDLLDGMEMDANKIRILSEQDLLLYCYRAAGSVGLLMSRLIGARDARAYSHAKSLGIAMQLTNIARDVGEDWRMGRCYIPSEWLCGSNRQVDRLTVKRHVRNLLRLADQHYRVGVQGLVYLPWHARFAIRSAAMLYQAIGAEISRNDDDTISKRAVVPWYRKLGVVFKSLCAELRFCTLQISQNLASKVFGFPQLPGELVMNCEARYLVSLGLSLTLIMATALFLMVGVNPKDSSYQSLPWIYAAMSAMSAVVFGSMAKRFQHQLEVRVQPKPAAVREKTSQNLY